MNTHMRNLSVLTMLVMVTTASANASELSSSAQVTVRDLEPQTVLYTIYRGSYQGIGQAYGKLYGLAGAKRLPLTGEGLTVHLNCPQNTTETHLLTEVRLSVPESALSLAGSLGPMTDVKSVPGVKVAVAVKPAGVGSPEGIEKIVKTLYAWIYKNDYTVIDAPMQRVLSGTKTHDYTQMKVEYLIPIAKPDDIMN
ncbi:GyrI-like domain-containing protein [Planctomycetota bacterium]